MKVRYRWYAIRFPDKSTFLESIAHVQPIYNECNGILAIAADDDNAVRYRFVSHRKVALNRIDKEGNLFSEEYLDVSHLDFDLLEKNKRHYIRVINPSRDLKCLFDFFEGVFGLGFSVKPIGFNLNNWQDIFDDNDLVKALNIKVTDLVIDKDIRLKIDMSVLNTNVLNLEDVSILAKRKYVVSNLIIQVIKEGISSKVELSKGGLVSVSGDLCAYVIDKIESKLIDKSSSH